MHYTAAITREGKYVLAELLDAPGCQTFAESEEALQKEAREALAGWLEAHLIDGDAPPKPKVRVRAPKGSTLWRIEVEPALAMAIELRWARQEAGLSQTELAKRAGVSQQQIAKLERPGENPTLGTLSKVAAALGASVQIGLRKAGRPAPARHRAA